MAMLSVDDFNGQTAARWQRAGLGNERWLRLVSSGLVKPTSWFDLLRGLSKGIFICGEGTWLEHDMKIHAPRIQELCPAQSLFVMQRAGVGVHLLEQGNTSRADSLARSLHSFLSPTSLLWGAQLAEMHGFVRDEPERLSASRVQDEVARLQQEQEKFMTRLYGPTPL